ncbi:MAG TPA: aminodeoxychorismate/anthranilate synthase component II [Planctomycetaceae bacterium]|nr:aminodeoxychorismate/anthranilate synthase component II [Planctomycetaceae bacterium]|tara:strand:- start:284 stop:961 length:678 start_codon:yes stop_codon:yes gene_type:complete
MIVVLDNRDSFVFNLARYFVLLGAQVKVLPSHNTDLEEIQSAKPQALVMSPGPCTPKEAGVSMACVRKFRGIIPILGVCLGHQVIVEALGGVVLASNDPRHGRMSSVTHDPTDMFSGIPNPMSACRYHSLIAEEQSLPQALQVTARTQDGVIMAVENSHEHLYGVQFHPESILTQGGFRLLANFLSTAGIVVENGLADKLDRSVWEQAGCDRVAVDENETRIVTF